MPEFGVSTPVVLPEHVRYHGPQRWLLWPALRYRVVSPLVHEDRLNVFQLAVLGLARSGLRDAREIGALLGLQEELVELVRSDLRALACLDAHGTVTPAGRGTLRDGFPDPTRTVTTYVYQDVMTGSLWPASTLDSQFAQATWPRSDKAEMRFHTAGSPLRVTALAVRPPAAVHVDSPDNEQIVEAVWRGEKAKRVGADKVRRWERPAPGRVVSRVSLITSGTPVWIPVPLLLDKRDVAEAKMVSWNARNPFNGRPSTYLRKLVATRVQQSKALRGYVERFVGRSSEAIEMEYDLLDIALRRTIAETLEDRFTSKLREHESLFELLTLLEKDINRARRSGDGSPELSDVARNSWRLHEAILRDVVEQHQPPDSVVTQLADPLARQLGTYCRQLGMPFSEQARVSFVPSRELRSKIKKPAKAKTPELLGAVLVSAANGDADHPFRRLAAAYPHLLTNLTNLSQDRNSAAHARTEPLNLEHGEAAWRLAQDTTAAYLGLPLFDLPLSSGKDSAIHGETA